MDGFTVLTAIGAALLGVLTAFAAYVVMFGGLSPLT